MCWSNPSLTGRTKGVGYIFSWGRDPSAPLRFAQDDKMGPVTLRVCPELVEGMRGRWGVRIWNEELRMENEGGKNLELGIENEE